MRISINIRLCIRQEIAGVLRQVLTYIVAGVGTKIRLDVNIPWSRISLAFGVLDKITT
ncbi:MAG TPA: hypothetical protein ACFYEL_09670 [Candidatus Wunengus californicus]|uniref:hypothetical protein n=1 Tax=Candidatus Wunengus californicus TaxID=3367619 RepID=UPI0040273B47